MNPLENFAPTFKFGGIDPTFEEKALEQVVIRSVSAIREYRSNPIFADEISDRAEKDLFSLSRNYSDVPALGAKQVDPPARSLHK